METLTHQLQRSKGIGAFSSWVVPVLITAAISALLSGGAAWVAFTTSTAFSSHSTLAGNSAQISALQDEQRAMNVQIANLPMQYVSQPSFAEFKSRYDKDQQQTHDFQLRIDTKIDLLLQEHGPVPHV